MPLASSFRFHCLKILQKFIVRKILNRFFFKFKKVETSVFKRFLIKIGIMSDKNEVEDYA